MVVKKNGFYRIICVALVCIALVVCFAACGNTPSGGDTPSPKKDMTLAGVGAVYGENDYKPLTKFRTLDSIYFPDGLLETGLGMWIYKSDNDTWVRTDTEAGRALFDQKKPTFISTHGMGWSSYADCPELYCDQYNVLAFAWGALADETSFAAIVDKVWLSKFSWKDVNTEETHVGARWESKVVDENGDVTWVWEIDDTPDASAIEMYCAYYYDFFSHFPDYEGSSIHLFGHSYGGMISCGATNYLITAYKCGLIPAGMLPDMITMLDPFMMRLTNAGRDIPWLGNISPDFGNICEVFYQTALACKELGITIRMTRFNKGVSMPAALYIYGGEDVGTSYWNFINNIVYAHLDDESVNILGGPEKSHNYAWDWFTSYYTGTMLYDHSATKTQEQALCFDMDYDASFARSGIKYNLNLNGTKNNTDDDVLHSFYREYKYDGLPECPDSDQERNETPEEWAKLTGKAKIAGFVYLDRNKNGKLDERIKDHLSGAKVVVKDASGKEIYSVTTAVNGYYEVEVDAEGAYTVSVTLPKGYSLSGEGAKSEVGVTIVDALHQLALNNFGATR